MIEAHFSYFDAVVVGILGFSCLFAFVRGFVTEILSLGAWVGAGLVTVYFFPDFAAYLEPRFKNPTVAAGIATLTLYISALMVFSMMNMLVMRFAKEGSDVGMLDNALGLVFGALRGVFIVSLGYFMLTMMLPREEQPDWLAGSYTQPWAEQGAIILGRAAPKYLQEISTLQGKIQNGSTLRESLPPLKKRVDTSNESTESESTNDAR